MLAWTITCRACAGLTTFVATLASPSVGAALAVAIAIHNVPEVRIGSSMILLRSTTLALTFPAACRVWARACVSLCPFTSRLAVGGRAFCGVLWPQLRSLWVRWWGMLSFVSPPTAMATCTPTCTGLCSASWPVSWYALHLSLGWWGGYDANGVTSCVVSLACRCTFACKNSSPCP